MRQLADALTTAGLLPASEIRRRRDRAAVRAVRAASEAERAAARVSVARWGAALRPTRGR